MKMSKLDIAMASYGVALRELQVKMANARRDLAEFDDDLAKLKAAVSRGDLPSDCAEALELPAAYRETLVAGLTWAEKEIEAMNTEIANLVARGAQHVE